MHPHAAEVMSEPWLHESAGSRIHRGAGRTQYFVNDGRHFHLSRAARPDAPGMQALISVPGVFRPTPRARPAAGASTLILPPGHPHHLFGDAVRFPLVSMPGPADD
jgi:hypothetical protein